MNICILTLDAHSAYIVEKIANHYDTVKELRAGQDGKLSDLFARAFQSERNIVCIMAAGIAMRMAAPHLCDKLTDPAIVVIDDAARYAISLVSGHEGGANDLAYAVAAATGATPIITTGTETKRLYCLGVGCRKGACKDDIKKSLAHFFADNKVDKNTIRVAATIDIKKHERGLLDALCDFDIPLRFFEAEEINAYMRQCTDKGEYFSLSAAARHPDIGALAVAEPCALLAARKGALVIKKTPYPCATFALAKEPEAVQRPDDVLPNTEKYRGISKGTLSLVGIGPGSIESLTPAARKALMKADFVVGYTPYLDLIAPLIQGIEQFSSPMTKEKERARCAIEKAISGKNVALVASGDACVYGIGGMALECISPEELSQIELNIIPGITAANAAAAMIGAPFENDYAVLSLSDLLTPRERILSRAQAIAEAGLPVALYNPRSIKRRDLMRNVINIFLDTRSPSTPAAIVRNISRRNEQKMICLLGDLLSLEDAVDMNSIVIIASGDAYMKNGFVVEPRFS